jgi:uncharacterized protein YkwD
MRSRIIGTVVAALLAAVALASAATAAPSARSAAGVTRVAALETDVLAQLNAVRQEHGLVALKLSSALSNAADQHSVEMGELGYFTHESADGAAFWTRIEKLYPSKGSRYWAVGENLLWSTPDVDGAGALKVWLASPEHKANILNAQWREIGISAVQVAAAPGTYSGLDVVIVTTDFGVRPTETALGGGYAAKRALVAQRTERQAAIDHRVRPRAARRQRDQPDRCRCELGLHSPA